MCIGKQDVRMPWATGLHFINLIIGGRKLFIVFALQNSMFLGLLHICNIFYLHSSYTWSSFRWTHWYCCWHSVWWMHLIRHPPVWHLELTQNRGASSIIKICILPRLRWLCRDRPSLETHHHHSAPLATSAWKSSIRRFIITEKAPTRAAIRHYAIHANQTARPLWLLRLRPNFMSTYHARLA